MLLLAFVGVWSQTRRSVNESHFRDGRNIKPGGKQKNLADDKIKDPVIWMVDFCYDFSLCTVSLLIILP